MFTLDAINFVLTPAGRFGFFAIVRVFPVIALISFYAPSLCAAEAGVAEVRTRRPGALRPLTSHRRAQGMVGGRTNYRLLVNLLAESVAQTTILTGDGETKHGPALPSSRRLMLRLLDRAIIDGRNGTSKLRYALRISASNASSDPDVGSHLFGTCAPSDSVAALRFEDALDNQHQHKNSRNGDVFRFTNNGSIEFDHVNPRWSNK